MFRTLRPLALTGLLLALASPALAGPDRGGPAVMHKLERLDLTEAQRAEIKSVFQENREALQPLRAEIRETRNTLSEAIEAGDDTATIAELAIARHTLEVRHREVVRAAKSEVRALLTEAQIAELKAGRRGARGPAGRGR